MGDWALSQGERQETFYGVATRSTTNVKGAFSQLAAATSFPYNSITLQALTDGVNNGGSDVMLFDLAIGASGSERVIVPNVLFDYNRGSDQSGIDLTLPVCIPAGTRLSVRTQDITGAGSRAVTIACIGRSGGFNNSPASAGPVSCYGANLATTNGTLIDSGATANAYGAWTEITSATANDHSGLAVVLGTNQFTGALATSIVNTRIAIGAAGSEVTVAEFQTHMNGAVTRMTINTFVAALSIPAGTRLSMAAKAQSSISAARQLTAVLLGY